MPNHPFVGKKRSMVSWLGALVANDTPIKAMMLAKQMKVTGITPAMRYSPA